MNTAQERLVSEYLSSRPSADLCDVCLTKHTGLTLAVLKRTLEARGPLSVRTCVLLDKQGRRQTEIAVDYVGFAIPNVFVVGYGLDFEGLYRNLPYVATLDAT